jgi:hypothetical protein
MFVISLHLSEIEVLADVTQAYFVDLLVHQELLGLVLFAQFLTEPEELFNRGMVVLLHDVFSDEVVNVFYQQLAVVCEISKALHQLLGASYLFEVHNHKFKLNH